MQIDYEGGSGDNELELSSPCKARIYKKLDLQWNDGIGKKKNIMVPHWHEKMTTKLFTCDLKSERREKIYTFSKYVADALEGLSISCVPNLSSISATAVMDSVQHLPDCTSHVITPHH